MSYIAIIVIYIGCEVIYYIFRNSASCTHVSALLHALVAMTAKKYSSSPSTSRSEAMPITSYLCQWKMPKKRKDSSIPMSTAVFEKHDYKRKKRKVSLTEDFDPRPEECRGTASSLLPELLKEVHGESLGVSILFDSRHCQQKIPIISSTEIPAISVIKQSVAAFKESLKMSEDKLREIEQKTREQRHSSLWFSVRQYRITASFFGEVFRRKLNTPPDKLVMRILKPRSVSSIAIDWGIENESRAIELYVSHQHTKGHSSLTVGPCGFLVSDSHPFLGATPDGTVYDPSDVQHPFGFVEVKCPYTNRNYTPIEACSSPGFCCDLVNSQQVIHLRRNHIYFAQVQGQMGIGKRPWCDFVIYTTKGISVERVLFDKHYWKNCFAGIVF